MSGDLHEITYSFDESLYPGGMSSSVENQGYPVALDGRGFNVDLSSALSIYHRYQRTTINLLNTQQSTSGSDQAQVSPEVWRRVVESWEQGSGQANYDRKTALPDRFNDSQNIDPWTPWQFSLIHETTNVRVLAAGTSIMLRVHPTLLVAVVGTTAYWFTTPTAFTTTTLPEAPVDATTDGQNLYFMFPSGKVEKYTDSTTHSTFATVAFVAGRMLLRYLKGFLVVASGNTLYDVSTGTPQTIFVHPLAGFTWIDGTEGLSSAFLLGGQGDRWHVASMAIFQNATTLDVPLIDAGPLPAGEIAYSLGSYENFVTVGSEKGWRFGVAASDGTITFGSLIDAKGPVLCFDGRDRFIWYGTFDAANTGLGRADLSTFIASVTPAYASDLRAGVAGTVRDVTTFQNKRMFTIDGVGVFAEGDNLAATGFLTQGVMTFNTPDEKVPLYAMLSSLNATGSVLLEVSYDGGAYQPLGTLVAGQVDIGHANMEQSYSSAQLRYTLTRNPADATLGPTVTRSEVRAMPITGQATEWRVPIIVSQDSYWNNGREQRSAVDDHNFLMDLVNTRRQFVFREAQQHYSVHVTDFIEWPQKLTAEGDFYQGLFIIVFRSVI